MAEVSFSLAALSLRPLPFILKYALADADVTRVLQAYGDIYDQALGPATTILGGPRPRTSSEILELILNELRDKLMTTVAAREQQRPVATPSALLVSNT